MSDNHDVHGLYSHGIDRRSSDYPNNHNGLTDPAAPHTRDGPAVNGEAKQAPLPLTKGLETLTTEVAFRDHISIIIGPPIVLLCDLVAPNIIYYIWLGSIRGNWWRECHHYVQRGAACPIARPPSYDQYILGYSIIAFGVGEVYVLLARVLRLFREHEECSPLLSRHKWELDATAWVYASALITALIPFIVSTSINKAVPWLFLYAPGFLFAYLELWAIITLFPFKIPVRVDSDPVGTPVRPLVYYAAEDFMAVDAWQGRSFRRKYRARYDSSPMFRRMILELTWFWIIGCSIYLGCLSAIIWNLPFEYAFGSSLGLLFGWLIIWVSLMSIGVKWGLKREAKWVEAMQKMFS